MLRLLPALALLLSSLAASAAPAQITLCYNYGCSTREDVSFSQNEMTRIKLLFDAALNPAQERQAISQALGLLLTYAGSRTPIHNDRGENQPDGDSDGRMDCIDHSTTTSALLNLLQQRQLLYFHHTLPPISRAPLLVNTHWTARIREIDSGEIYAVDTWFRDNGQPAVILPIAAWQGGAGPEALNPPAPQQFAEKGAFHE